MPFPEGWFSRSSVQSDKLSRYFCRFAQLIKEKDLSAVVVRSEFTKVQRL